MSIAARLEDSSLLLGSDRVAGALLSALVAVGATSRKRYPKKKDGDAFKRFLGEEMCVVMGGAVKKVRVRYPGADKKKYKNELMPLQDILYKYVRCSLAHEAGVADEVQFLPTSEGKLEVKTDRIVLTQAILTGLMNVIRFAPENADEFPDLREIPDDVIGWFLFGKRRDNHAEYLKARRNRME